MTTLGALHQARIAEDESIFFIDVERHVEKWLTDDDEFGDSDLSWLQDNYYRDRDEADPIIKRKRTNKVGLSANDFLNLAYPDLSSEFREWWNGLRDSVKFPYPEKGHVMFNTNLLDFPWALLPLSNGKALSSLYSVSCNPGKEFLDSFSGNDVIVMSRGKIENVGPQVFNEILGNELKELVVQSQRLKTITADLKVKIPVHGAGPGLWRRGKMSASTPEEVCAMSDGIMGIELKHEADITARVLGEGDTIVLPSIWLHEGHGHDYGLELSGEERSFLRGAPIAQHLESTQGSIDFCWLSSCHGIQMACSSKWMEIGKIKTLLGHLGMGDEDGNIIAFEMLVLERLMRGYSVGRSVQLAKQAMDPEMSASGSFTLLGDPRLVLVD